MDPLLHTPETKRSSAEWTAVGESRPKRSKTQQWAVKVMASVFDNAHGILFIDYLEKDKTINSDYYMALLDRSSAEIGKTASHAKETRSIFLRLCQNPSKLSTCHSLSVTSISMHLKGFRVK